MMRCRRQQLVEPDTAARGHVEHLARNARRFRRPQHAVDDVADVGEVAGLLAVAVHGQRTPLEPRRDEERDHTRIDDRND